MIRYMPKTYVSGIRIPYAESERLRKLAYDQRTTKTAILTAALREYLDKAEAANGSIVPEES
jgi:predicted transcriptional regulator